MRNSLCHFILHHLREPQTALSLFTSLSSLVFITLSLLDNNREKYDGERDVDDVEKKKEEADDDNASSFTFGRQRKAEMVDV